MSWPLVKLGDIFKISSGGTPSRQKSEYYDGGEIHWVKTGDLHNRYVESASEFITEAGLNGSSTRLYPKGTVLLAMYGATIGACSILNIEACTNQACAAFIPSEKVDVTFFYYLLKHNKPDFIKAGSGGAQPNISATFLKDYKIPLPPLEEQKRIAEILDKADAIRQKRKQAIQLADDFLRSVFLDMFGDPVTNPKGWEVISMADYGTFKNGLNFSRDESGVSLHCLGVGNFKSLDRIEDIEGLPKVELSKLPQEDYLLKNNDLVFVRSNGNKALVGRCVTVHPQKEKVTFSGFCIRFRISNPNLDPNFLNLCLRTTSMKNEMLQGGQGANIQNINQKSLASLRIPLPPIEDQKRYSDLVSTFRLLLTKKQNSANNSSELFNSLSQKAFAGNL